MDAYELTTKRDRQLGHELVWKQEMLQRQKKMPTYRSFVLDTSTDARPLTGEELTEQRAAHEARVARMAN